MKDISLHISRLLFEKNKLIIPGLGYFTAETVKAYIHPVSNEFVPRTKRILFTKNTAITDDVLINAIGENNAEELIKEYVRSINASLEKTKEFYFQNIGWLRIHQTGTLIFEQKQEFNYDKSYFGLEPFTQVPVAKKVEEKPIVVVEKIKKKKPKVWLWLILLLFVAATIAGILYFKDEIPFVNKYFEVNTIDNQQGSQDGVLKESPVVDTLAIDSIAVDTVNDFTDSIYQNIHEDTLIDSDNVVEEVGVVEETEIITQENKNIYFVIAGCFRSQKKADDYVLELKSKGYEYAAIEGETSSGLKMVCYKGFPTKKEANQYMKKVSKQEGKELWVQKILE